MQSSAPYAVHSLPQHGDEIYTESSCLQGVINHTSRLAAVAIEASRLVN
ncbi:MAG: hypothetical protein RBJ76_10445 [Stenomitos frigidus ULC029]